jgi:hypothetical protein
VHFVHIDLSGDSTPQPSVTVTATPPRSVNNNLLFNSNCYYSYVYFTFIDLLSKAIGKTVTRHSSTMATQRAAEKSLGAAIFIPPKAIEEDYGLFQALSVEGKNGKAEFNSIHCGITEKFIKKKMPAKIQELKQLLVSAEAAAPNEFAESIQLFEAKTVLSEVKSKAFFSRRWRWRVARILAMNWP